MTREGVSTFSAISDFVRNRQVEFKEIPDARREQLAEVASYIRNTLAQERAPRLVFICTHNSRRSHLSQVWAQVAAKVYGHKTVETFSGGTETTAFNPRALASLRRCGFEIETEGGTLENPVYLLQYSEEADPLRCFSKVYDQAPNPGSGFCAVMTCSEADAACPAVFGCELRAAIRYEDPKVADDTPEEAAVYDERSRQICREMLYMMSLV